MLRLQKLAVEKASQDANDDIHLHGPILANKAANLRAALRAVAEAVKEGMPEAKALKIFGLRDAEGKIDPRMRSYKEISRDTVDTPSFGMSHEEHHNAIHGNAKVPTTAAHMDHPNVGGSTKSLAEKAEEAKHWDKHFRIPPHHFLAKMTHGVSDLEKARINVSSAATPTGGRKFSVHVKHPSFETHKEFTFGANGKPTKVYHDSIRVKSDQGANVGKHITHNAVDEYKKMGAPGVHLKAAGVGAYAWPKYGFAPDKEDWHAMKPGLKKRASQIKDPDVKKHVHEVLKNPDPKSIWKLSDINAPHTLPSGTQTTVGKHMLMNNDHYSHLDFGSKSAMDRHSNYISPNNHGKKPVGIVPESKFQASEYST